ncbi:alkaline phosphatase [Paenibacillus sp. FSL R7-0273]|uniref:alkaline phosphatase n=1 Tax=Paenibacillus sp. FSL R7-0273 TaxID=1536772 RepID=UPI0004F6B9D5|nr:alkaline phosphatase [Paenibacillus sp. FSL R7-0273]AIQ49612.1 alkaline phosphatase [Paenibacillus sp. FSL R7-0273]OMF90325.1 alkaline phosphatase [Paenibacillus sp. FSL R7-0273]
MNKLMKGIIFGGLAAAVVSGATLAGAAQGTTNAGGTAKAQSKNLIVLIGDGMGPAQISAARYFQQYTKGVNHLNIDPYYVGQATTYADRGEDGGKIVSGIVTDSASAGTAFATGHKTYNAGISVSNEDVSKPFASIIEAAESTGKATGLVTTARITHATPAVYASHVRSRDNEAAIASQYLESGVDVLMGGGKQFFVTKEEKGKRTDKSLLPDFKAKGYTVVENASALNALTSKNTKVLGLFGSSHVAYVPDRTAETPSLAAMTSKALNILSADKDGFVMMIEGGRIDHAGHANDLPTLVQEALDFDAAFKTAIDFAKKNGNTSVVVTADHETGGLSLSRDNIYEINIDLWNKQKHSSESLAADLEAAQTPEEIRSIVTANTWITDLSDEEVTQIMNGDGSSYKREGAYNAVISKRLLVGWSGHGHSAVDVGVWAYGPIADKVKGQVDNTQIATAGAGILGLDLNKRSAELQSKYLYPKFKISRDNEVLYPAEALAKALGGTYKGDASAAKLTLKNNTIDVSLTGKTAKLNNKAAAYTVDVDNGVLYLPLTAFNQLTGTTLKWDALSERLILR